MSVWDGVHAFFLFLLAGSVLLGVYAVRGVRTSVTWATEGLARIGEIQREALSQLAKIAAGGDSNALSTRISELETGLQGQRMLVADAVDRVTALANRVAARQRRASAELDPDDEPETGPTPEQAAALRQLLRDAPSAPAAEPGNGGGTSLKERAKLHRAQRG